MQRRVTLNQGQSKRAGICRPVRRGGVRSAYEQVITPSTVDAAPAPIWTVHWVKPVVIEVLLTVAVQPLATPATVAELPAESDALVLACSAAKSAA